MNCSLFIFLRRQEKDVFFDRVEKESEKERDYVSPFLISRENFSFFLSIVLKEKTRKTTHRKVDRKLSLDRKSTKIETRTPNEWIRGKKKNILKSNFPTILPNQNSVKSKGKVVENTKNFVTHLRPNELEIELSISLEHFLSEKPITSLILSSCLFSYKKRSMIECLELFKERKWNECVTVWKCICLIWKNIKG